MKKLCISLVLVFIALTVSGCAAPRKKLATPSGNPEITINKVSKKQLIDLFVDYKLSIGFQIRSVNDYSLVIAKNVDDWAARVAYGSEYNRTPEARVTYNFVDVEGGVKVFVRIEMVTNPQSPYEKVTNLTGTGGERAQAELEAIKEVLEK